jgi:hypothetical protein
MRKSRIRLIEIECLVTQAVQGAEATPMVKACSSRRIRRRSNVIGQGLFTQAVPGAGSTPMVKAVLSRRIRRMSNAIGQGRFTPAIRTDKPESKCL